MDNYRMEGRGEVKSTSKWWGQAAQLVLTISQGNGYSFIYSHLLLILNTINIHCLEYGSLFVSQLQTVLVLLNIYHLLLPAGYFGAGGGGGGCVILTFTVFGVCARYLGVFWPAASGR